MRFLNNDPKNKKPQDNKPQNGDDGRQGRRIIFLMVAALIATLLINSLYTTIANAYLSEITYNEFQTYLDKDEIAELEFQSDRMVILTRDEAKKPSSQQRLYYTGYIPNVSNDDLKDRLDAQGVEYNTEIVEQASPIVTFVVTWLLPVIIMYALFSLLMRGMTKRMGGGIGGIGESKAKVYMEKSTGITFADVAGQDEAKESLVEIIDFLHNPQKYAAIGAKLPKGALLVGPPGTGKTLLAKAVAGEASVPFFSISGSDFVEMFVGVGASRVRDLFEQAKKAAPCIIFIDEIDAVGRQRGTGLGGGHDEREQTLNQLLVEMDGFGTNDGVVVLAATNRAAILDPALLRPSRFDRQIYVGYPDIKGREDVLKIHTANKPLAEDVDLAKVARGTAGFTGADLENLSNEAALLCARRGDQFITMADFEEAEIKVLAGPEKRSRVVPEHERKLTAYHEAGHAVVMHALPTHEPVHRITIVPRGHAGGMTISLPDEDHSYQSKRYMEEQIVSLLGGRAAEKLMLGDISTGASNDIERASHIARKMVTAYGMSEKLGPITFGSGNDEVFLGRDYSHLKNYSEETAAEIDEEINRIITTAYCRTEDILKEHIDRLHAVAGALIEREKISGEEFETIMHGGTLDPLSAQSDDSKPAEAPEQSDAQNNEEADGNEKESE